ncbi:MAG: alpha/beta hydrolase [Bradyrhizobiaceae bacterium]|nr:alpha/beta hydrolase [Bradyrhizobiaceae bacterium]
MTAAALLGAILIFPPMTQAQMPPDIAAKVAALGRVVDPENTGKIYTPLQEKEPYAGIKVVRDVSYGPHARNVVDIFIPESGPAGRPVLMFVHGGGYTRGNKRPPGSAFYDNIMVFAARHGMVGVNVEYRLAPEFPWPAGVEDMSAAVRFVNDKIATYGGDPARVFLMGHSAGAGHVAAYVSHPEFHGPKGAGIAGAIFSSGPSYVIRTQEPAQSTLAYFGSDTSRYAEREALPGLVKTEIPFMFSSAELDPPNITEQFEALKDAMCKSARGCARSIVLPRHSHMSEPYAINTADTQFSDLILAFIKTAK